MLGETYPINPSTDKLYYLFRSQGPKGEIIKIVLFQDFGENRYNLAFGDLQPHGIDDGVVSNNADFVKVLSTVTKCAYEFIENYPGCILEIRPFDERRRILYNAIFKRHHQTIQEKFTILGEFEGSFEEYAPDKNYHKFELHHII